MSQGRTAKQRGKQRANQTPLYTHAHQHHQDAILESLGSFDEVLRSLHESSPTSLPAINPSAHPLGTYPSSTSGPWSYPDQLPQQATFQHGSYGSHTEHTQLHHAFPYASHTAHTPNTWLDSAYHPHETMQQGPTNHLYASYTPAVPGHSHHLSQQAGHNLALPYGSNSSDPFDPQRHAAQPAQGMLSHPGSSSIHYPLATPEPWVRLEPPDPEALNSQQREQRALIMKFWSEADRRATRLAQAHGPESGDTKRERYEDIAFLQGKIVAGRARGARRGDLTFTAHIIFQLKADPRASALYHDAITLDSKADKQRDIAKLCLHAIDFPGGSLSREKTIHEINSIIDEVVAENQAAKGPAEAFYFHRPHKSKVPIQIRSELGLPPDHSPGIFGLTKEVSQMALSDESAGDGGPANNSTILKRGRRLQTLIRSLTALPTELEIDTHLEALKDEKLFLKGDTNKSMMKTATKAFVKAQKAGKTRERNAPVLQGAKTKSLTAGVPDTPEQAKKKLKRKGAVIDTRRFRLLNDAVEKGDVLNIEEARAVYDDLVKKGAHESLKGKKTTVTDVQDYINSRILKKLAKQHDAAGGLSHATSSNAPPGDYTPGYGW